MSDVKSLKDLKVVAFAGYAGAGKGTAGLALAHRDWKCFSFATPLREIVSRVYHVPMHFFTDPILKNEIHPNLNGKSPRKVLQLIGTEGFRHLIDEDTWVKCLERDVLAFLRQFPPGYPPGFYIDDLRFLSEIKFLQSRDVITVYVENPNVSQQFSHQSEDEIGQVGDKCDYRIINDGTISDLLQKVGDVMDSSHVQTYFKNRS